MREPRTGSGPLFTRPPLPIVAIGFAVVVAIALGWTTPILYGRWRGDEWMALRHDAGAPPLDPSRGALLGGAEAMLLSTPCSRRGPPLTRRLWKPTPADIGRLEADLPVLLASIDDTLLRFADVPNSLRDYLRQYAGLELVTGERIVYVSAFDPAMIDEWRRDGQDTLRWHTKAVVACDGWRGFWGVEYDPARRRFRNFAFNGIA